MIEIAGAEDKGRAEGRAEVNQAIALVLRK